jgi:hypothetical protein
MIPAQTLRSERCFTRRGVRERRDSAIVIYGVAWPFMAVVTESLMAMGDGRAMIDLLEGC